MGLGVISIEFSHLTISSVFQISKLHFIATGYPIESCIIKNVSLISSNFSFIAYLTHYNALILLFLIFLIWIILLDFLCAQYIKIRFGMKSYIVEFYIFVLYTTCQMNSESCIWFKKLFCLLSKGCCPKNLRDAVQKKSFWRLFRPPCQIGLSHTFVIF